MLVCKIKRLKGCKLPLNKNCECPSELSEPSKDGVGNNEQSSPQRDSIFGSRSLRDAGWVRTT